MLKASELIKALEEGKLLSKLHHNTEKEFLFLELFENQVLVNSKGWGTAFGKPEDRFADIIKHPNKWTIEGELTKPYPWSIDYKPFVSREEGAQLRNP